MRYCWYLLLVPAIVWGQNIYAPQELPKNHYYTPVTPKLRAVGMTKNPGFISHSAVWGLNKVLKLAPGEVTKVFVVAIGSANSFTGYYVFTFRKSRSINKALKNFTPLTNSNTLFFKWQNQLLVFHTEENKGLLLKRWALRIQKRFLAHKIKLKQAFSGNKAYPTKKVYKGVAKMLLKLFPVVHIQKRDPMIIRDQKNYQRFVQLIFKYKINKKKQRTLNNDPLLQKSKLQKNKIDFTKNMLLVVFCKDTISQFATILGTRVYGRKMVVKVKYPVLKKLPDDSYPVGLGSYTAVLVKRFTGTIEFREKK